MTASVKGCSPDGAFGKGFCLYSLATLLVLVAFGAMTGLDGPRVAANLPTPWAGLTERMAIRLLPTHRVLMGGRPLAPAS